MAGYPGVYPPDPSTPVGWLRVAIGDDNGTDSGSNNGQGTYTYASDATLQTIVDQYPDDRGTQIGIGYQKIGMRLIEQAQLIQVDDIKIQTEARGKMFLDLSAQALSAAAAAGASTAFEIVPLNIDYQDGWRVPEGTPMPFI